MTENLKPATLSTKVALPGHAIGEHYIPLPDHEADGVATHSAIQTILVDPQALYSLWRDVTLFPRWQENVVSVTPTGPSTSHWVMGNPDDKDGKRLEFDSKLTEDTPGHKIAWTSTGGDIDQSGAVTFIPNPNGRGTLVTLTQTMKIPGAAIVSKLAGAAKRSPEQTIIEDLRHFKQLAETGEIPSIVGQPHGPRGVIAGVKQWMYGETNPTPPGTSDIR